MSVKQSCTYCAWKKDCQKRFSEPTGGERCPDFTWDEKLRRQAEAEEAKDEKKEEEFEEILPGGKSKK